MKKTIQKSIKYLVTLLLIIISVTVMTQIKVHAASNVDIYALMEKFPDGKYWNHVGTYENNPDGWTDIPCPHVLVEGGEYDYYVGIGYCNSFGGDVQCVGFANRLVYEAYGVESYEQWEETTLDELKPGDVIRYKFDMHTIFVTSVDGEDITYGDCNAAFSDCQIKWGSHITKSEIALTLTAVYSAPTALSVPLANHSVISDDKIKIGHSVECNAIGEGGTEKYTYQFYVMPPSSKTYTVIQAYGEQPHFRYTPTETGLYKIKVAVKDTTGQVTTRQFDVTVRDNTPITKTEINGQTLSVNFPRIETSFRLWNILFLLFFATRSCR